ncbi:MAG: hypothetical protein FJX65_15410 [Alphaproteobacteria bacterium]|nr:hypothetical protein [Alphaproteobacteria bacterium]
MSGRPGLRPPDATTSVESGILESFPDPVVVVGGDRAVVAANRAAREIIGPAYHGRNLALALRHPEVLDTVDRVLRSGESRSVEVSLPGAFVRTFNLQAVLVPAGETTAGPQVALVFHDVTVARQSEAMRRDFVANVSHELRSPLSALLGMIETLQGPACEDVQARERFLGIMNAEARRMTRLIEDLLSLSRVEIHEHVPPRGRVDLAGVLRGVVDSAGAASEEARRRIAVSIAGDLPKVVGDADELRQVLQNLVDNALKYSRPGTAVRIDVRGVPRVPQHGGPGVAVSVSDESEGIPAEDVPRLTERFYRVDKGRSRSLGGTGLGLAIVKHIINRHRGHLAVESRLGVGSTFTVTLPAAASEGV